MNVKLLEVCFVLCVLRDVSGVEDEIETSCNINGKKALQYVGEKFLSFTIDPAVLLAGVSLSEDSLRLAKQLSPAFIRLAGPSTPFVRYRDHDDRLPSHLSEDGSSVVVSPSMWFGVNEWLRLAGLVPVFGLNDAQTARGVWNPKEVLPLLEISDKLNVSCYWQLGYDSSNKSVTRYMQDLNILDYILAAFPERNETWKIVGSDISHIPPENTENTLEEVEDIITAVMWEPSIVKDDAFPANDWASKILQRSPKPNYKFWTTVPKSEGPVTFASALLWAKQLGNAAKTGYDVVFRQPRILELFSDTPAYWLSLLHKRLMGSNVLDARPTTNHAGADIFAHCTRKQNSFVRRGAMTVMIINDNDSRYKVKIKLGTTLPEKSMEVQTYLLTSPGLNSTAALLNGRLLTQDLLHKNFPFEPKIRRSKTPSHVLLTVPPRSIGFFVLPGARVQVCIDEEKETELLLEEMELNQNMPLSEEILKLESRSSFGQNHVLDELAQKMRQEMKSDQQYYSALPLISRIEHDKEEEFEQGKIDDRGRRLFIERVNLSERQKKHMDFQKKREELKKFLMDKAKTKREPKIETKSKHIELTSVEAEKILKDRAKQRAAKKNVVFTDEELDALIQKASKKSYRKKSDRIRQKRYINMQLLERTMDFDPIALKHSATINNDDSENFHQEQLVQSLKRSVSKPRGMIDAELIDEKNNRFRRDLDIDSKLSQYKMKLAERSRKWDEMKDGLLGNTETMRENLKEKLHDLRSKKRFTRDLKMVPKTSQLKVRLAERSRKWDEKKNDLEARKENVKEKLRRLRNNGRNRRALTMDTGMAGYEERLAENRRKWEETMQELQENAETMRKNMEERLENLRNKRRFTRDLGMNSKLSQYKIKLAERSKKWEERKEELLGNAETMRENMKEKLQDLRNKKRFTRDLNDGSKIPRYKLAQRSKKWDEKREQLLGNTRTTKEHIKEKLREIKNNIRIKRDINMDLLDTNTKGQKNGEKKKTTKNTINSKKLKDAEATIRQPGQTSSEIDEENLEGVVESVEPEMNKEVYAELADSEDLEEEFYHTTPKPKKHNIFDKKSKLDPFAIPHPTIDIVEPTYMKPKKSKKKKKKSKSEDELQFLTSSQEFTDIEDDLPCIHEYFGPDSSVEDKKTRRIMQELGEIFGEEKSKTKKSKKKKPVVSDEDFRRKRRDVDENHRETPEEESDKESKPTKGTEKSIYLNVDKDHLNYSKPSAWSSEDTSELSTTPYAEAEKVDEIISIDPIPHDKPEKIRTKRGDEKEAPLHMEDDFKSYRKEVKKHLKDLKNILDGDKLKYEQKKQKNKLKLLQLKRKEEMELANEASDRIVKIHNEENEHGNQILEQLKNLRKELQLRKDKIDQVLRKDQSKLDEEGEKKNSWNPFELSTRKAMNGLKDDMKKVLPVDDSPATQKITHSTTTATTAIETIEPKVIVQKRSIFDTRQNIFDIYQPMSLDLPMWKPADVLTLQKDLNPLSVSNLVPPNDFHIFKNLLGQSLFRKRRSIDLDNTMNDIDNDVADFIDDDLNGIKKDRDFWPEKMKTMREEDYELVLPNKDKFEMVKKDGDTEIKFEHHENMRGDPEAMSGGDDDLGDDAVFGGLEDSSDDDGDKKKNSENETTTGIDDAFQKISNIQKISNKEEAKIFEDFIRNFTGFLSHVGNHIKDYFKFMTDKK